MDFRRSVRFSCSCLIILLFINTTIGYRNYNAVLYGFKCTPLSNVIKNISCNIDKSGALHGFLELQKEADDIRLDTSTHVVQKNNDSYDLYNFKGLKACEMFVDPVVSPILRIIKKMLLKYCNMPERCPIPSGFVFKMANYTFNTDYLPDYLPECTYKTRTYLKEGQTRVVFIELAGKIVHKKIQTKGRKTSNTS